MGSELRSFHIHAFFYFTNIDKQMCVPALTEHTVAEHVIHSHMTSTTREPLTRPIVNCPLSCSLTLSHRRYKIRYQSVSCDAATADLRSADFPHSVTSHSFLSAVYLMPLYFSIQPTQQGTFTVHHSAK